jgi:carboxyl-terminal processing protease
VTARQSDKVGVEANDEITHIDKEAVRGLTQEEVVEKLRGAVGTKVVLTTLRKGRTPLELTVTRGEIQAQPLHIGSEK